MEEKERRKGFREGTLRLPEPDKFTATTGGLREALSTKSSIEQGYTMQNPQRKNRTSKRTGQAL